MSHNIDADVKKIEQAGGKIIQPKMEIPGVGWWALFQEPTGIVLALFESKTPSMEERRRSRARTTARRGRKAGGRAKGKKGRRK